MSLLANLFIWLFSGLAEFFGKYLTKKAAAATAGVTVFSTLTLSLLSASAVLINTFIPAMPGGQYVSLALWLVVPDNGPAVVSACIAMDTAVVVYRWNVANLNLINQA